EPGSATHPLALQLLALNKMDANVQLRSYAPEEAARQLIAGKIDVAMMLAGWNSTAVQMLLHAPGIELMGLKRADAYVALAPKFSKLMLPQGVADLGLNRPPADVPLIASKASLAVRRDLHAALQYLLVRAALEVHAGPGIFQHDNEFPAPEKIDLPMSDEALHVYKVGPSILQRTLPFWLAELLQRLLVIVLPIVGILYPLWSLLPRIYRWQMQRRIFRLYGELRLIERTLRRSKDPEERAQMLARMQELERQVLDLKMPQSFSEMSFNLKMHIRALSESAHKHE
ncbi:MAG TPA: TAXI family TRAP transporter solute-binding subunit, partial [Steroidobacteraceae bacterium]|nr:TAXI family TRAP transporter solute-binding subunit [Steroidobacteraceae bacterium]